MNRLLTMVTLVVTCAAARAEEPDLVPREVFFGNPDRTGVQISPDGESISFLSAEQGVLNVWVQTIGTHDARAVTSSTMRPIRQHFWAQNGRQIIYLLDRDGDENFHVHAVDLETDADVDLTPIPGVQARLVAADRRFPDEILVGINDRVPQLHDIWRINTRTGDRELVFQNDQGYVEMIADSTFAIRAAVRFTSSGGSEAFMRDTPEGRWYQLARWDMTDALTSSPLSFSRDGGTLYVMDSRRVDTGRLYAFTCGPIEQQAYEMLAWDDRADLGDIVFDPATGRPQAALFEYERPSWIVLDESIRRDLEFLEGLADGELSILSRNRDDDTWIVSLSRDDGPTTFYLYRRRGRDAMELFTDRPALARVPLAEMQPVVIRSRDGLDMVSYLTTPPGGKARALPMVLLVHGGPWGRDRWGYNPIHQWLANRGYAVLSVNFRGSTGFGKGFINAGNREWAGRMHDDLLDAVQWAIDERIADPERVAIMGGSYGGYAVLVGLAFTPDVFAAGVDIVGPSHVGTLLESIPPYWKPIQTLFETRVGSLDEPEYLDSISPLTRVEAISAPLLIGQGLNDPRVKEAESAQIVDSMQARQLPVTYVMFPDEGHGFARPENSMAFFAITEAFLARHLGGRAEPIGSDVRSSSAEIRAGAELIPGLEQTAPSDPQAHTGSHGKTIDGWRGQVQPRQRRVDARGQA